MFTDACKKNQVSQQFTEIDIGGTTRAQCNMCQRDVVSAGRALLDNVHELRDAAITSWRGQSTKFIILKLNNDLEEKSEKNMFLGKNNISPSLF